MIFKQKQQNTFETQDEWFDRHVANFGKVVSLLALVMGIAGGVAHLVTGLYLNTLLDAAIIAGGVFGLVYKENVN